jgi:hypothetical protein
LNFGSAHAARNIVATAWSWGRIDRSTAASGRFANVSAGVSRRGRRSSSVIMLNAGTPHACAGSLDSGRSPHSHDRGERALPSGSRSSTPAVWRTHGTSAVLSSDARFWRLNQSP